jgi:serine/threonine-protein kinase
MIGKVVSHYKILEKLGEGGMGVVYKAHDTTLDRDVALKFLPTQLTASEEDKQRFTREARTASSLDHPNICNVHEIDETPDGQLFIVMAIYDGTPLNKKIEQGPFKLDEAMDIAIQAAEGLQAAHEKSLVHRDIKSGNIMVTDKGRAVIMDFGLAQGRGMSKLTKTGSTVGTVPYMSPEQARGDKVDHRSDIWSLGVVLYEMVAGRLPFRSEYHEGVVYSILNEDPPPLTGLRSDVPMMLESIVNKCLEKNPSDRYQHAEELVVDLRRVKARSSQVNIPRARTSTRRRFVISVGAFAVLALLAYLAVPFFKGKTEQGTVSLAVLPLENLSADSGQEYFANGITDALITELGQINALRVRSRTSTLRYAKTEKSLPQIAKELNVDMVVEGSVSRSGEKARITAKLIQATEDRQVWTKSYERDIGEFLVLESEIAHDIARQIGIRVTEEARLRLTQQKVVNPKAFDLYLKGVTSGNSDYFEEATRLDPDFGMAYAKIASGYFYAGLFGAIPAREAFSKMREAAQIALDKDNTLGEAHSFLALAKLHVDFDWVGAEKEFKRAIELNPSLVATHHFYAHFLMATNRIEESAAEIKLTAELDPFSPDMNLCFGWHCLFTSDYNKAIELASKGVQMKSEVAWSEVILGWSYEQKSMFREAITEFQNAVSQWKDGSIPLAGLAHAYAIAGNTKEAREALQKLLQTSKLKYVPAYDIAAVYAGLGENDLAFQWLSKAFDERSGFLVYIKCDRRFDVLRSDPRFLELIRKMNLPI